MTHTLQLHLEKLNRPAVLATSYFSYFFQYFGGNGDGGGGDNGGDTAVM